MRPLGDPHNFGKCVELVEHGGRTWVKKPRTIFWEWQLLDSTSELRTLLDKLTGNNFKKYLGHISYKLESGTLSGLCEFRKPPEPVINFESVLFTNYGRLMAFATILGIIDLHSSNIIIEQNHLQILDIECLLFDAATPADTLLLPNRTTRPNGSIFETLDKFLQGYTPTFAANVIDGFVNEVTFFLSNLEGLISCFLQIESSAANNPIRFLLRDSHEYLDPSKKRFEYIESETIQMARSDIPYFFGYLGNKNIFYYIQPEVPKKISNEHLKHVESKLSRSFCSFEKIFNSDRIFKLLKQSLVMLAARFEPFIKSSALITGQIQIQYSKTSILVKSPRFCLEAPRKVL